jgi:hypothetical protein
VVTLGSTLGLARCAQRAYGHVDADAYRRAG